MKLWAATKGRGKLQYKPTKIKAIKLQQSRLARQIPVNNGLWEPDRTFKYKQCGKQFEILEKNA